MTPSKNRDTRKRMIYLVLPVVVALLAVAAFLASLMAARSPFNGAIIQRILGFSSPELRRDSAVRPRSLHGMGCAGKPAFEDTAAWLATCLRASAQAEDVERILTAQGRIGPDWGGVSRADVLPGGGQELIVRYHADLKNVIWNPQGKLIVLQQGAHGWRVAYDPGTAPGLRASDLGIRSSDGTPWDNWSYRILQTGDVTGDGLDDLLVDLLYSNGLHAVMEYCVLLTAHPGDGDARLRSVFMERTNLTRPVYRFVGAGAKKVIQAVISVTACPACGTEARGHDAITRTLSFTGDTFELVSEAIDPRWSTASAVTSDGAQWYAFDEFDGGGGSSIYSPNLGLYRLRDGRLWHFDIPATIRVLKAAPDGSLYVGAGLGVLRFRGDQPETLVGLEGDQHPAEGVPKAFFPFDIAFAPNGDVWVGGIYSLARFDGKSWAPYDIPARRLLVAPDGSVWTEGWDGRAGGDCCYTHLTGSTWVTYTHTAALPVPDTLRESIEALRR
jgi:hypothetical protein